MLMQRHKKVYNASGFHFRASPCPANKDNCETLFKKENKEIFFTFTLETSCPCKSSIELFKWLVTREYNDIICRNYTVYP